MGNYADGFGELLSDVRQKAIQWLWEGMIPIGYVTILEGDPGLGKSTLALDLAARISAGADFPDCTASQQAGAVLLTAEDGLSDVVGPRLEAAGANLAKVVGIPPLSHKYSLLTLERSEYLEPIATAVREVSAKLIIVDPLVAFLDDRTDSHKDHSIRRALGPLTALAQRGGVAVVAIRHLNKSRETSAIYRGGGSIGIIGAARSGFVVAKKPGDERKRVLASVKSNLSRSPRSFEFILEEAGNGSPKVKWLGRSNITADSLVSRPIETERRSAVDEAKDFLLTTLTDGPQSWDALVKEAADFDISEATLRRARSEAGFRSHREGFGPGSQVLWSLPESV